MKELLTRALSGGVYVGLILGATLYGEYSFLALISSLGVLCLNEFLTLVKGNKTLYILLYFILGFSLFYTFQFHFIRFFFLGVICGVNILLFLGMKGANRFKFIYTAKSKALNVLVYQILGFVCMAYIPFIIEEYQYILILGLFVLIWVNDSFAYLTGVSFGKTKLCPSISPNKSVEGFLGGMFTALIASFLLYKYIGVISLYHWMGYGIIASVIGSIGDLVQSKFKRIAGVKDSGSIMPGHGGIFDRLDSVLYASPFVLLLLNL